jgi:hypothetical protein
MKRFLSFAIFIAICGLLIGSAPITNNSTSAAVVDNLSATTNYELARARNGTAKYHDFARADSEGFDFLACVDGEGFEYVNGPWLTVTSTSSTRKRFITSRMETACDL